MLHEVLWEANAETVRCCLLHPFVRGLAEGTLEHEVFKGHPVNGEVGTWLAPSGSQICSPFACPYSRLQ